MDGADVESVLTENQTVESAVTVSRNNLKDVDIMLVNAAFQMPRPQDSEPSIQVVNLASGDIALLLLDEVITPEEISGEQIDAIKQQRRVDVANSDFDFALTTIRDAAEIQRNTDLLQ